MTNYIAVLGFLLTTISYLCHGHGSHGQIELESHGGRSPHERFHDAHYKNGQHDEHMDHQAILGSKKTADEFDTLAPEESKKRLRLMATKMDTNVDGFVDKAELKAWIFKSLKQLDREETDERFDEIDEDRDGFVTFHEYVKEAFGEDDFDVNASPEKLDKDDQKLFEEDKSFFTAADMNLDRKLSKDEFAAFQNPESHIHMHNALIDSTLVEKDRNKNGLIDFNEFLGEYGRATAINIFLASKEDSEWYQVESDRFKNEYDLNKDGQLDRDEMRKWLVPDLDETAKDEMEHLFSEADKNHDAKLSYDEIVNEYNLFVGSEATNYGEHLEKIHEEL